MPPSQRAYGCALLACREAEQWSWVEHFSKRLRPLEVGCFTKAF